MSEGNQSKLDAGSIEILETAAKALIKNLKDLLVKHKAVLAEVKKSKKPMSSRECRDFLFALISNPVLFVHDEAKENLGFMNEEAVEKILGDHDCQFDPDHYWDERDNYEICRLVLRVAERHLKEEYVYSSHAKTNIRDGLKSAAEAWLEDSSVDE